MGLDWKEISQVTYWKQIAAEHDKLHAMPWHLPRAGASLEQIEKVQQLIGFLFPFDYAEFLTFADGWKGFCVLTNLYGTEDFLDGRFRKVIQRPELRSFLLRLNTETHNVIPVDSSEFDLDVFLLFPESSKILQGGVLWFAADEVDRYPTFSESLAQWSITALR